MMGQMSSGVSLMVISIDHNITMLGGDQHLAANEIKGEN